MHASTGAAFFPLLADSLKVFSPDPKDDPFCLCSEEGNADFIVTLNPKDFPQERLRAKVISPEAMA
jgi:hypothetical protein